MVKHFSVDEKTLESVYKNRKKFW